MEHAVCIVLESGRGGYGECLQAFQHRVSQLLAALGNLVGDGRSEAWRGGSLAWPSSDGRPHLLLHSRPPP